MPSATFATLLQSHLQRPGPGCIFVQATTTSDQLNALRQIRQVCQTVSSQADQGSIFSEIHPNLLGTRVIDVRNDIAQAFQSDQPESSFSTSTSTSTSMASTVSIYPDQDKHHNSSTTHHRVIAIPSAHLLRSTHSPQIWSQLLYPPSEYTIILISSLPLDRWRTAEGVENLSGHRPIVKMSFACHQDQGKSHEIESILSNLLSQQDEEQEPFPSANKFQSTFITFVLAALTAQVSLSDVEEIKYLTLAVWKALCAVVDASDDNHGPNKTSTQSLLSILRPLLRSALNTLHPRRLNVDEWIQQQAGQVLQEKADLASQSQHTPHLLPPIPSLLLLSAFLCSHIPSKSDSRLFLRDEATLPNFSLRSNSSNKRQRRARKKIGIGAQSHRNQAAEDHDHGSAPTALLLGPKPFPYQRMMYVFQNLCVEFDVKVETVQQEFLRRQRNDGTPAKHEQEATPHIDVFAVAIHRELQRLIAHDYIFVVSPPFSTPAHYHDEGNDDDPTAAAPPSIPLRLEHLNQITMRCNLLKEEVKHLVVPHSTEDSNNTQDRKQWWARVEECGL